MEKARMVGGWKPPLRADPALPNDSVIDKVNPRIAERMKSDGVPRKRLGYNVLTNLGHSKDNPPADFAGRLHHAVWCEDAILAYRQFISSQE